MVCKNETKHAIDEIYTKGSVPIARYEITTEDGSYATRDMIKKLMSDDVNWDSGLKYLVANPSPYVTRVLLTLIKQGYSVIDTKDLEKLKNHPELIEKVQSTTAKLMMDSRLHDVYVRQNSLIENTLSKMNNHELSVFSTTCMRSQARYSFPFYNGNDAERNGAKYAPSDMKIDKERYKKTSIIAGFGNLNSDVMHFDNNEVIFEAIDELFSSYKQGELDYLKPLLADQFYHIRKEIGKKKTKVYKKVLQQIEGFEQKYLVM